MSKRDSKPDPRPGDRLDLGEKPSRRRRMRRSWTKPRKRGKGAR